MWNRYIIALIYLLALTVDVGAQNGGDDMLTEVEELQMIDKIANFRDEASSLENFVGVAQKEQLASIQKLTDALAVKWDVFYNSQIDIIAEDDSMLTLVSEYETAMQSLNDSIARRGTLLKQYATFVATEKAMKEKLATYDTMYGTALKLSLLQQTAPQLEKLKAEEQLMFKELQKNYDEALTCVAGNPRLAKRMEKITETFVEIKYQSEQIQAMTYMPFMQRIKDYVMNLAAFAIIMMFIMFITTKLQSVLKIRKAAKEMAKLTERQNEDIPTI